MASMKSSFYWNDKLHFDLEIRDHKLKVDGPVEAGGQNNGPTPKELALTGIAGCSAMDVISILTKMRQPVSDFKVHITSDMTTEHPKIFKDIWVVFEIFGEGVDEDRVHRAVELSMTQYCGVSAMIAKSVDINYKVFINDKETKIGKAEF